MKTISLDEDLNESDWTKTTWDLPPYMSPEFLSLDLDLDAFRKSPTYKNAVDAGLIHDDEWVGDYVSAADKQPPAKAKSRNIHIHLELE